MDAAGVPIELRQAIAAAGDEQDAGLQAGGEQGARHMAAVGHVSDEGAAVIVGERAGRGGIVRPRVDLIVSRGIQRAAVLREGDAMVELCAYISFKNSKME